jgi:hypothetical protein
VKAGVMSARKSITVTRTYRPEPEACARALSSLLRNPLCKGGGPDTTPKDDVKESNGYVATSNHNR